MVTLDWNVRRNSRQDGRNVKWTRIKKVVTWKMFESRTVREKNITRKIGR